MARAPFPSSGPGIRRTQIGDMLILSAPPRGRRASPALHPWQPIRIGNLGFRLRLGLVTAFGRTLAPSNANAVFTCPPNNVAGYFVWLKANISGGTEEEPADFESLVYESGTTLPTAEPGDPDTGALPTVSYCALCCVTSTATAIDPPIPYVTSALQLDAQVEDITCQTKTRSLIWRGLSATPVA